MVAPYKVFLFLLVLLLPGTTLARIVIDVNTAILISSREPKPLQKAAADLASDFKRVFGRTAKIVHEPREATGASVIWIILEQHLPKPVSRPEGWECYRIQSVGSEADSMHRPGVVLTGSDVRGAIYAVYQFSQQFLGMDPLYWWTDHTPAHRARVEVPDDFSLTAAPTFRYRGWFINDEDLLTGWRPGWSDHTGISLDTWDHIFEALLRLKGNMIVPGTFIFPDEPQIEAAGHRGLVVTQHHVNTLGLNTYRWPSNQPMSYLTAPKLLDAAWRRSVSQYPKDVQILWSIGYRGTNDQPFWEDDPNAPATDAGRAKIVSAAIEKQMEIVRSQRSHPEFFMNAWQEAGVFIHEGALAVPSGASLVWADDGHGILADGGTLRPGDGEYYHTAMHENISNHYTEMVPLERIQRELGRAARVGATQWLLVNTANIRPVVMTTRAVMELAWDSSAWSAPDSLESSHYRLQWSREEFGERAALPVAEYYQAYFGAPARYGPAEGNTAGDEFYLMAARFILTTAIVGKTDFWPQAPTVEGYANLLLQMCDPADQRWQHAQQLAEHAKPLLPQARLKFFQGNVLSSVNLHQHLNRMVADLARMTLARNQEGKRQELLLAIEEGEHAARALHAAEYGQWAGFYTAGDWLLDLHGVLAFERAYLDQLEGRPGSADVIGRNEDLMRHFYFAYFRITGYQGTRHVEF